MAQGVVVAQGLVVMEVKFDRVLLWMRWVKELECGGAGSQTALEEPLVGSQGMQACSTQREEQSSRS